MRAAGYLRGSAVHDGCGAWAVPKVHIHARDTERVFTAKLARSWPLARRTASLVPPLCRVVHRLAGAAER